MPVEKTGRTAFLPVDVGWRAFDKSVRRFRSSDWPFPIHDLGVENGAIVPRREPSKSAAEGPNAEFVGLFQAEYPALVQSMYVIVHDREQARDIAQEAFAQLFTRWRRVSQYDRPDAWVRRVAIRMAVRAIRRERLRRRHEREFDRGRPLGPVDLDVLQAVAKLPGAQRAAVVLFYLEDRPVAEVADMLGCSEVTARVHLHRARKRLAEILGDEENDTEETIDAS
jgi:RNA polymerase sigma-70 factor (ECF subfamily)